MLEPGVFGYFDSHGPDFGVRSKEDVAQNGTYYEKAWLADDEDLEREVFLLLAKNSDIMILTNLAMNFRTPPDILDEIAKNNPSLHGFASTNANASIPLLRSGPLSEHISLSLEKFLDTVNATENEIRALFKVRDRIRPPGGITLGEAWDQVRPPTKMPESEIRLDD